MRLELRTEQIPKYFRHVDRFFSLIDERLLRTMTELVTGKSNWPLLLWGKAGGGKTLAALCLLDVSGRPYYSTVDRMADKIIQEDSPMADVSRAQVAVLDELGGRTSVPDLLYRAVKDFTEARIQKPTIYITNVSPKQNDLLDLYDDRVFSRIACGTWFELKADDRRME